MRIVVSPVCLFVWWVAQSDLARVGSFSLHAHGFVFLELEILKAISFVVTEILLHWYLADVAQCVSQNGHFCSVVVVLQFLDLISTLTRMHPTSIEAPVVLKDGYATRWYLRNGIVRSLHRFSSSLNRKGYHQPRHQASCMCVVCARGCVHLLVCAHARGCVCVCVRCFLVQ